MGEKLILQKRLRKIEGQIRGLQKMIASERDCEEILTQLASINGALKSVSLLLLKMYINRCIIDNKDSSNTFEMNIQKILNKYISAI